MDATSSKSAEGHAKQSNKESSTSSRTVTKVRKTVTLDEGLLRELESRGGSVSAQVNEFIRQGLEWERRQEQILALVAEYEDEFGAISASEIAEWESKLA